MKVVGLDAITVEYIQHCGDDLMVVKAARASTGQEKTELGEEEQKLIRHLVKRNHLTPFEMCDVTFLIECPIFVARQFQRHRTFSYNEWSGEYSEAKYSETIGEKFYVTREFKNQKDNKDFNDKDNKYLIGLMEYQVYKSFDTYTCLLDRGISREIARLVLPQNMMTRYYAKANLRNWIHYCSVRCESTAQFEHKYLATKIFNELLKMYPISVGALAKSMFSEEVLETVGLIQKTINVENSDGAA